MARWAASAAAPAKNDPVSGAGSFFGATTGAGEGVPKVNPVVGVLAAFKLEKNEAVAASGFEGLGVGVGVEPTFRLPNGELEKVEKGEFLAWFVPAPPWRTEAAKGLLVVEDGGVEGVTLRLRPPEFEEPKTLGLMGVVAVDAVGAASLGGACCALPMLEARFWTAGGRGY